MKIVLVHGINTVGTDNIDRTQKKLEALGLEVVDAPTKKRNPFTARWMGKRDAKVVQDCSADGDILVCHSYGNIVGWHAHKHIDYRAIFCIAPAQSKDVKWIHPNRVHCYFSEDDRALKVGSLMLYHPFGRAGLVGYTQPGVNNVPSHGLDHSDYFFGKALTKLVKHIKSKT